jgi:hypothetical protein
VPSLTDAAKSFLIDLCTLLRETALDARAQRDGLPMGQERTFADGRLMAYQEVISLIQNQAIAFQLDASELGIADIVPERDLF